MKLSAGQCRAARALLAWTQQELMAHSGVSQKTIADFERGASTPYPRTIRDFVEAFEKAGIEFLQDDGSGGIGLRFKLGFQEPNLRSGTPGESGTESDGVSEALSWEDDFSGIRRMEKDPELVAYWSAHPQQWARLSKTGKRVLNDMMFGSPEAADEVFGSDAR
jgi:transcriptional regulator with XRE-family HTH domain